jgi:hypothetical protein
LPIYAGYIEDVTIDVIVYYLKGNLR